MKIKATEQVVVQVTEEVDREIELPNLVTFGFGPGSLKIESNNRNNCSQFVEWILYQVPFLWMRAVALVVLGVPIHFGDGWEKTIDERYFRLLFLAQKHMDHIVGPKG